MSDRYRFLLKQLHRILSVQYRLANHGRADEIDRFFPTISLLLSKIADAPRPSGVVEKDLAALEAECHRLNQEVTVLLESEYDALGDDIIRTEARRKITEFIRGTEEDK